MRVLVCSMQYVVLLHALISIGERVNAILMYFSPCFRMTRWGQTLDHRVFVLGSFERSIPLVEKMFVVVCV